MTAVETAEGDSGGSTMPKFITLISYTDEGVQHFKDFEDRMRHARIGAEELGVTVDAYYMTMGRFDALVVLDAPDAATVAQLMLANAANGRIRSETLAAFTEAETATIASALPI